MGKVTAFNFVTLDGYIEGPKKGDISWHRHGAEENEYAAENLKSGSTLLFGRVTHEMMARYWPTPIAIKNDPIVAEREKGIEVITRPFACRALYHPMRCKKRWSRKGRRPPSPL